jgi:REP element-mobilizing transposase RayT
MEYGRTYHIYNRGVNGADLFLCQRDYEHFLDLYAKYINPVVDTYAWVLLRNHFHILARIKEKDEMPFLRSFSSEFRSEADLLTDLSGRRIDPDRSADPVRSAYRTDQSGCEVADRVATDDRKISNPSRQFSHLFNGYARYFNTRNGRHGQLFETPFKRKRVNCEKYFRRLVYYIHHNPVKHGFAEHILDWGWSSYLTIISVKPTRLSRETVLGYFDSAANFKLFHQEEHDLKDMENLLLE